jgi:hypothetical protein
LQAFILALVTAGLACCALHAPGSAQEVAGFKVLKLEGNSVRWQKLRNNEDLVITYRVATAPTESPGARNCRKMASLDELVRVSELDGATIRREIASAFAMWEAAANVRFREAPEGAPADILIGAQAEPEGWAFADVFYEAASPQRVKPISQSLICLNPTKRWKVGFNGDLKTYDLRYTIAHEIGHAIGLDHPSGDGQIMGYRYEERFRSLQPGDVQGAVLLYGERRPANAQVASELTAQTAPQPSSARRFAKRWGTRAFIAPSH